MGTCQDLHRESGGLYDPDFSELPAQTRMVPTTVANTFVQNILLDRLKHLQFAPPGGHIASRDVDN